MADFKTIASNAALIQAQPLTIERQLSAGRSAAGHDGRSDAELEKASEQFEALLLNLMIREMRATVPESALFPKSMAQDIYTGMLDERIAGQMSQDGGIGISRMIFDQLKRGE